MTRVVQLANFYGPQSGGLKTVVEELARCYAAVGVDRVLIAPGPSDGQEIDERGTRLFLRAPVVPRSGGYRMILQRRRLFELLDRIQPDVVEVSDKLTLVAAAHWARERAVPCTLLSHERIDAILGGRVPALVPLRRIADARNRTLARAFDAVICPSRFARHEFERIGAANAVVVPWGVDLHTFSPRAARGTTATRKAAIELLCVGRLSEEKEPALAVDTVMALHRRRLDVHLTMVGTGPMQHVLERRARHLPVTFTGHLDDRRDVARLMAAADVTLVPGRAESFGLVALESLACGTPVVTSTSGAAFEVCGPGTGLAAPHDAGRMADAVRTLLRRDRRTLSFRARERAEQFPWSRAAEAVLAVHLGDGEQRRGA